MGASKRKKILWTPLFYFRNLQIIRNTKRNGGLKLHLGCGKKILEGWLNIDIVPYDNRSVVMKLPKGLKAFKENSIPYIYMSHVLEHLDYRTEALNAAKECHRLLKPGGVLRIVVPGIERIIQAYVKNDGEFFQIQRQRHPSWCTTKLEHLMYALQQNGQHKFGYDFETVSKLLSQAGFKRIINSDYNLSQEEELRIDYHGRGLSLFVEAVKTENMGQFTLNRRPDGASKQEEGLCVC